MKSRAWLIARVIKNLHSNVLKLGKKIFICVRYYIKTNKQTSKSPQFKLQYRLMPNRMQVQIFLKFDLILLLSHISKWIELFMDWFILIVQWSKSRCQKLKDTNLWKEFCDRPAFCEAWCNLMDNYFLNSFLSCPWSHVF